MARQSSSNGSSEEKHEVFLSFRGEDTRKTFTSHLNAAFTRLNIRTYIDYNLERGDEISATLLRAIEDAKLSVIVFSRNYANSKWCLDELLKILECRKRNGQIILPVFYDIDPSFVRNQIGSYADAFAIHEQKFRDNVMKVQRWRDGLAEAANHSGWDCSVNRLESETMEEIAMDVLQKLNCVYVGDLDQQIAKYEQLAKLLDEYSQLIPSSDNFRNLSSTEQRINELKMERSIRMLRLTPEMLSHMENSNANRFFSSSIYRMLIIMLSRLNLIQRLCIFLFLSIIFLGIIL